MNKTNGTSSHVLICMMVKVPAVFIVTKATLKGVEAVAAGFFGWVNYYSGGT